MHKEILSADQNSLLPLIKAFSRDYYLVGGTAIALQIGHRRSIDFDLFTTKRINRLSIRRTIERADFRIDRVIWENSEQLHLIINGVKLTFFCYPFAIIPALRFESIIRMPDLVTLAAMKAFALGGRAKWKDYVDLYFLLTDQIGLQQIIDKAKSIFGTSFTEKLFREQLSFFKDMDYEEEVEYLVPAPSEKMIREFLVKLSIESMIETNLPPSPVGDGPGK